MSLLLTIKQFNDKQSVGFSTPSSYLNALDLPPMLTIKEFNERQLVGYSTEKEVSFFGNHIKEAAKIFKNFFWKK